MKPRFLVVTLGIISALTISITPDTLAQSDPIKFGKIELADLQMKSYDKDTSAEAVVLCDYGKAFINNQLDVQFERIIRIKILKKSGYKWATGELLFTQGSGALKISNLKGITYNLQNGEIVKDKLEKESIFNERKIKNLYIQKFTLPNVKEGSVIEYAYTVTSAGIFELHGWQFQAEIPTVWSEYRVSYPEYFKYKVQMTGYQSPSIANNLPNAHRWVYKDVPAIRSEAYITTIDDYVSKVEFELGSVDIPGQMYKSFSEGWSSANELLLNSEDFGTQLKKAGFLKETIATLKKENKDPRSQALAAYEHIRKHMTWNEGLSIYSSGNKKTYDEKKGDSGDINLLLIAMLREMGLDVKPVLLSTRDNGRIMPYYATVSKFNYVVALLNVDGQQLLLDATDQYITPGMLPTRCLNGIGRIIEATGGDWISLEPKEKATELTSFQMTLTNDGDLQGKIEKSLAGYDAWEHRKAIVSVGKDKHTENLKKAHPNWQIDKIDLINIDKCTEVLNEKYELTMADVCQKAGNTIYLKPMLSEALTESPFKQTERKYPVDFGTATEKTYVATIIIPEGFKVEEMPKNTVLTLPENSGRFSFLVGVNGNTIQVSSKLSLKKTVYYADEYAALREFYAQIVSKHAEQIVLKKI